jgi:hypothetical protein
VDHCLVATESGAGANDGFIFQSLQSRVSKTLSKPSRVEDAGADGLHTMVLSENMQLIFRDARGVGAEGEKGVYLEKSVSEVQDEDVGLGVVVLEPILCSWVRGGDEMRSTIERVADIGKGSVWARVWISEKGD